MHMKYFDGAFSLFWYNKCYNSEETYKENHTGLISYEAKEGRIYIFAWTTFNSSYKACSSSLIQKNDINKNTFYT